MRKELPDKWPTDGKGGWNKSARRFIKILNENEGFWPMDMDLKYLDLRIDTRDTAFLLYSSPPNKEREIISPDRVIAAIKKYREFIKR